MKFSALLLPIISFSLSSQAITALPLESIPKKEIIETLLKAKPNIGADNFDELDCDGTAIQGMKCTYIFRIEHCEDGSFSSRAFTFIAKKIESTTISDILEIGGCQ